MTENIPAIISIISLKQTKNKNTNEMLQKSFRLRKRSRSCLCIFQHLFNDNNFLLGLRTSGVIIVSQYLTCSLETQDRSQTKGNQFLCEALPYSKGIKVKGQRCFCKSPPLGHKNSRCHGNRHDKTTTKLICCFFSSLALSKHKLNSFQGE